MPNLHVFTGDQAADTVRQALRIPDDAFLVQHDVISCGPLHAYTTRAEWSAERKAFWLGLSGGDSFDPFPNDLVDEAERLARADRLTLWVGAGLSDRLLLPSVLALCEILGVMPPIEVMEITSHKALSVPVLGWGMLRPADIGRPQGQLVTTEARSRAISAWAAVTSDSPSGFLESLEAVEEDGALLQAMSTLIERYPDTVRGLSHWDASLLAAMPAGESKVFDVVGGAIGANFHHLDPVGDMYLFWRLRRMSEARDPLVTLRGDTRILDETLRQCRVQPTPLGLAVREARANQTDFNGVDDWVGGVHLLASTGSPWHRRNGELIPQSAI